MNAGQSKELERLLVIIESYGADPARWPSGERAAALTLLAESSVAQAAQREAARLDAVLAVAHVVEPSAALRRRIAAIPAGRVPSRRPGAWPFRSRWVPALGMAAAIALGVLTGSLLNAARWTVAGDGATELSAEDWAELSNLAFANDLELEESR